MQHLPEMGYKQDLQVSSQRIKKDFLTKPINKNSFVEGQGLVEYALVLLLVAIVVIAILVLLGPQLGSMFSAVSKGVS